MATVFKMDKTGRDQETQSAAVVGGQQGGSVLMRENQGHIQELSSTHLSSFPPLPHGQLPSNCPFLLCIFLILFYLILPFQFGNEKEAEPCAHQDGGMRGASLWNRSASGG